MRVLVDTHAAIWYSITPSRLSIDALACLNNTDNDIYISITTAWEIAIKCSIGKLSLPLASDAFIREMENLYQWKLLPVSLQHVAAVQLLDHHHRDPFDRMLIAQAKTESLRIVSADTAFDAYGIKRIWQQ